jgi:hypothetical protein
MYYSGEHFKIEITCKPSGSFDLKTRTLPLTREGPVEIYHTQVARSAHRHITRWQSATAKQAEIRQPLLSNDSVIDHLLGNGRCAQGCSVRRPNDS